MFSYAILWCIASIGFLISLIMIIPNIMSLANSGSKFFTIKGKLLLIISKCFLWGGLIYPIIFLSALFGSKIFDFEPIYFLIGYLLSLLILFLLWYKLDK